MRGMVFTAGPIKPDVQHINPVAGFKRLFSTRSFTEFLKTLFKLLIVAVALVIVYRLGLQALMERPAAALPASIQPFFRF